MVLIVAITAAGLYAVMRIDGGQAVRSSYAELCARLVMRPGDWPCRVSDANTTLLYIAGSLSVGLGLAIPCMVLAATGRRLMSLLPLIVPVVIAGVWSMTSALWYMEPRAFGRPYMGMWPTFGWRLPTTFWFQHPAIATAADLLLLGAPAIAVALFSGPPRERPATRASWSATIASLTICVGASGVLLWGSATVARHLWPAEFAFTANDPGTWIVPALAMATFGWLLGPDRRWWPWILAPVAILLTGATMTVLLSSVEHVWNLSGFGAAIPYFGIGLVCSFVRPLAARLSHERAGQTAEGPGALVPDAEPVTPGLRHVRLLRPRVMGVAAAASMLAVSATAFLLDPGPAHYAEAVPTYLGARTYVQDLKARSDLWRGMVAVNRYRERTGSLTGFDALAARTEAPWLAWTDGVPASPTQVGLAYLGDARGPTLVEISGTGTAFCARDGSGRQITYGSGGGYEPGTGDPIAPADAVARAVAACGSTPFTSSALRPFPIDHLCDGAADEALLVCRAVQDLLRRTMGVPELPPASPPMI